jgi:hypothetical protein
VTSTVYAAEFGSLFGGVQFCFSNSKSIIQLGSSLANKFSGFGLELWGKFAHFSAQGSYR